MKKNEEKKKKTKDMVYGKLIDMFDLVLEMTSKTEGMTLKEIQAKMGCSNRTAKRIIKMLKYSFFDLITKKSDINPRENQYKINRSKVIDYLTNITTDEIKSLKLAKVILEDNNLYDEAKKLSKINDKILNSYKLSVITSVTKDFSILSLTAGSSIMSNRLMKLEIKSTVLDLLSLLSFSS